MTGKLLIAAWCTLAFSSTVVAQTDFREALRIAFPATVSVQVEQGDAEAPSRILRRRSGRLGALEMFQDFGPQSGQTGFAVAADLIATQLSSDIDEVSITTADGKEFAGKVVSRDYVTGLTLVKIDGGEFVSLTVGGGMPEAGLPVVMTRLGATGTVNGGSGMISSGPTTIDSQLGFTQYLGADLSHSDAGAPIVDAKGAVVGIVGVGRNGDLLCLPTQPLQRLIAAAAGDSPSDSKRGMVGIQFKGGGAPVVMSVAEGSPAESTGIETGDRVVRANGYDVATSEDVLAAVAMARAGDEIPLVVKHGEETKELVVKLKEHPRQEFAMAAGGAGQIARQAWQLQDGKLVPLDGGDPRAADPFRGVIPQDLEKMFENFPNDDLILPGLPRRLEGTEVEPGQRLDSLPNLESDKQDQEDQIQDLQKKLRELQNKLQDS